MCRAESRETESSKKRLDFKLNIENGESKAPGSDCEILDRSLATCGFVNRKHKHTLTKKQGKAAQTPQVNKEMTTDKKADMMDL